MQCAFVRIRNYLPNYPDNNLSLSWQERDATLVTHAHNMNGSTTSSYPSNCLGKLLLFSVYEIFNVRSVTAMKVHEYFSHELSWPYGQKKQLVIVASLKKRIFAT